VDRRRGDAGQGRRLADPALREPRQINQGLYHRCGCSLRRVRIFIAPGRSSPCLALSLGSGRSRAAHVAPANEAPHRRRGLVTPVGPCPGAAVGFLVEGLSLWAMGWVVWSRGSRSHFSPGW